MKKEEKKFQALILIEELTKSITKAPNCTILGKILQNLEASPLIDEIFIFCNKNRKEIKQILARRKNKNGIQVLYSECGNSVGDRLREVHSMRIINSDFVLIR
jgi:2-C-methyl-D-erythritol 4-phosphate cytidylyltransferase